MPSRMLHSFASSASSLSERIRPKPPPVPPKLRISAPMPLGSGSKHNATARGEERDGLPPLLQGFALGEQQQKRMRRRSSDSLARQQQQSRAERARFVRWHSADKVRSATPTRPPMPVRSASMGASYYSTSGRRRRLRSSAAIRAAALAATAPRPRPGVRSPTWEAATSKPLIDLSGSGWYCADPDHDVHAVRVREAAEKAREAREARREARRIASLAAAAPAPELHEEDRLHILARGPQSAADARTREDWWAD